MDPDRPPETQANGGREKMEVEVLEPEVMDVTISSDQVRYPFAQSR